MEEGGWMENGFSIKSSSYQQMTKPSVPLQAFGRAGEQRVIFAGNSPGEDQVSDRFVLARKIALHKVFSQFEKEYKIDEEMSGRSAQNAVLKENIAAGNQNLLDVGRRREALEQYFTEEPGEQEQKDLELVRKVRDYEMDPDHHISPTEEEWGAYEKLPPLTDYQKAMLLQDEYDKEEQEYRNRIRNDQGMVIYNNAVNEATQRALLKAHPMLDVMKEADAMIDDARGKMIQSLFGEGVEKVDKDMADLQEKLAKNREEALEEKAEQEQEITHQEVENTVLETVMQATDYGSGTAAENLQKNIKSLIRNQIALETDVKGLVIDAEC